MPDLKKYEEIIYKFIATVLAASVTGLLSNEKNILIKIKNLIAGICGGSIVIIMSMFYTIAPIGVLFGCVIVSAFISSFWPLFGEIGTALIRKYFKKKTDGNV
jgi:hypothetical protein